MIDNVLHNNSQAAGLVVAYVGDAVMERFKPERWVEEYLWKIQLGFQRARVMCGAQ